MRRLNPLAPIRRAVRGAVALDDLLGRGGFDLARIAGLEPQAPDHIHDPSCGHAHGDDIASVSLASERAMDREKISAWLERLVAERGPDILRAKGIISVADDERRLVFQAVHMLLDGDWQRPWKPGERRQSRLVFIGRHLDRATLEAQFQACAAV
ncbi:MAG: CobW family GTP-binding protein [Stellaceae bacterium]